MPKRAVVAIDGPAGAGKSTLARRVAQRLGFVYIDTGAMYRAVALKAMRTGVDLADESGLAKLAREARIEFEPGSSRTLLDGEDVSAAIRAPEMSPAASQASVFPGVRRALVEMQRKMGAAQSVVMEGRDIGSVVFPDAQVKIYLDADPAVRAARRVLEMEQKGQRLDPLQVEQEIRERDVRDSTRADSPLIRAPGAISIDSTALGPDAVEQVILKIVRERI